MVSRDDRRAAAVLVFLVLVGTAVRLARSPGSAPGGIGYRVADEPRPERMEVEERLRRAVGPLAPGETVDVDRVDASQLVRLPRIGPALAARIVRDRTERGGFGSLEALGRVAGIGPSVLDAVRPYVTFSAAAVRLRPTPREKVSLNTATRAELEQLPGIGPARARAILERRTRFGPFRSIDDLRQVRGIGPATVERLRAHLEVR